MKALRARLARAGTLALCLFPAVLSAQDPLRTLSGTVVDRHNEPLREAVVQLQNEANTGSVVSYITGPDGAYIFKRLSPATDYSFWATYRGHRSRVKSFTQFDTRTNKVVKLTIRLR